MLMPSESRLKIKLKIAFSLSLVSFPKSWKTRFKAKTLTLLPASKQSKAENERRRRPKKGFLTKFQILCFDDISRKLQLLESESYLYPR